MQDPDEGLAGAETRTHLRAERARLDSLDELLDHRQGDVRLEQRNAHLAQCVGNVVLGQPAATAQGRDRRTQTAGELVKHGEIIRYCLPPAPGTAVIPPQALCYGASTRGLKGSGLDKAPTLVLVLTLLGLLVVIAFSSGTEVAMLSVNRYRIRSRASAGERRARMLERLLTKPDQWLGANLVILALASVAASTVATLLALRVAHAHALPAMMLMLTVIIIIFCELAP